MLVYAQIIGDYDRVLSYYLNDRQYSKAIGILTDAPFEKVESLIYKSAPLLMEFEPEASVAMFANKPRLRTVNLLPALLRYSQLLDKQLEDEAERKRIAAATGVNVPLDDSVVRLDVDFEGHKVNFAIDFLQNCINNDDSMGNNSSHNIDPAIYHTFIWLLSKYDSPSETELVRFLQAQCDRQADGIPPLSGVDNDYILRQCQRFNRKRSTVLAFLLLGLNEQAIQLALSINMDLAKVDHTVFYCL